MCSSNRSQSDLQTISLSEKYSREINGCALTVVFKAADERSVDLSKLMDSLLSSYAYMSRCPISRIAPLS